MSEEIKHNRRRFLGTAAMTLAAAPLVRRHNAGELFAGSLMSSGVFLTMNIATAAPEQLVSYHSTRVDGLEIFYREAGPKDASTILLLHGLPSSSRMYQSLLASQPAIT
jgi:hypothetical protein